MSAVFENIEETRRRNWYVRTIANEISRIAHIYMKGENLLYFRATLDLIASDAEGFAKRGYDFTDTRFYGHVRKGRKLIGVKAKWRT